MGEPPVVRRSRGRVIVSALAAGLLATGLIAGPAAASDRFPVTQDSSPFAQYVPPSLNYQGCPGYAERSSDYGYFSYDLIRKYTPNGGLIYLGVYGTRLHFHDGSVLQTGIREYIC
jgi:hypothetical protein